MRPVTLLNPSPPCTRSRMARSVAWGGKEIAGRPPVELAVVFQLNSRSLFPWLDRGPPTSIFPLRGTLSGLRRRSGRARRWSGWAWHRWPPASVAALARHATAGRHRAGNWPTVRAMLVTSRSSSVYAQTRAELRICCCGVRTEQEMTILLALTTATTRLPGDRVLVLSESPTTGWTH